MHYTRSKGGYPHLAFHVQSDTLAGMPWVQKRLAWVFSVYSIVLAVRADTVRQLPAWMLEKTAPVILSNLIVCVPDAVRGRVICVDKQSGSKVWDMQIAAPATALGIVRGKALLSAATNLVLFDPQTKVTETIGLAIRMEPNGFTVGPTGATITVAEDPHSLSLFDTSRWRRKWSRSDVWRILHRDETSLLVLLGSKGWVLNSGAEVDWLNMPSFPKRMSLALLSETDGDAAWTVETHAVLRESTSVILTNSILITAAGRLTRINRSNGTLLARQIGTNTVVVPLWLHNQTAYALRSNEVYSIDSNTLQLTSCYKIPTTGVISVTQHGDVVLLETEQDVFTLETKQGDAVPIAHHLPGSDHRRWMRWDSDKVYFFGFFQGLYEFDLHTKKRRLLYAYKD